MHQYERVLKLHRLFKSHRRPVDAQRLREELGCSRATLYRDIAFLRDVLGAPLDAAPDGQGYAYAEGEGERFELPGLWLTSEELAALMALEALVVRSDPGVLAGALAPFRERVEKLLNGQAGTRKQPLERIRVVPWGARRLNQQAFRTVAGAVLARRQLRFRYRARTTGADNVRHVSPQRLTHYRDNWYLDAWDHDREALRSFAVDRIGEAEQLETPATDRDEQELNETLASSYGIFAGAPKAWATIRFSAKAARWVADEHWHSLQEGRWLEDGRYELKVPYSQSRELVMDILRYGPDAEVVAPPSLREEIRIMHKLALDAYQSGHP
ncbi:MAG TPA: transcriptional regulator [Rhodanobacteraceae bacterium]|nr:transcriptional regulator [Rhodanobacteraceae bacterium]